MITKQKARSGQVLIIVLMIMVVALTIGLAVATRSITDVRLTTQSEQSERAYAAAEAGVEYALSQDLGVLVVGGSRSFSGQVGDVGYTVNIEKSEASNTLAAARPVEQDDVIEVRTSDPDSNPPVDLAAAIVTIYWVDDASTLEFESPASLEVTEVYDEGGDNINFIKYAFNAGTGGPSNGFDSSEVCFPPCQILNKNYIYKKSITLQGGTLMLRIKPIYNLASIALQVTYPNNAKFPSQSYTIEGEATVGNVTRRVKVVRPLEYLPPIFDFALFAEGDVSK